MPKLQTINANQTSPFTGTVRNQRATADAFGGGQGLIQAGKTINAVSDVLQKAQNRIDNRADTIDRAQLVNQYQQKLNDEASRLQNETNIADRNVVKDFGTFTKEQGFNILNSHSGSPDSKAKLTVMLEDIRANSASVFGAASVKIGRQQVNNIVTDGLSSVAADAGKTGDINTAISTGEKLISDNAAAFTPQEERDFNNTNKFGVVTSAFNTAIANGDLNAASAALSTNKIGEFIDPATLSKMRTKLIVSQHDENKAVQDGQDKLTTMATILGIPVDKLSPQQRNAAANISEIPATPSEKLAAIMTANKKAGLPPPTDIEQQRILGIPATNSKSNASITMASARGTVAQIGPDILNDTASQQDIIDFTAATNVITQESTFVDPTTQLVVTRKQTLSQNTQDALQKLGVTPQGAKIPQGSTSIKDGTPDKEGFVALSEDAPPVPQDQTAWSLSALGTGAASAGKNILESTPVVGDFFNFEGAITAREQLTLMSKELVSLLRTSKKGEIERQEIQKDVGLAPEFFTTEDKFKAGLIGIENNLNQRIKDAVTTITSLQKIPLEERQFQLKFISKAQLFIDRLGVPNEFKTPDDAVKANLAPGTEFRIKGQEGEIFKVKGTQ